MKMFFKNHKAYKLAGTMEDARRHILSVAKNWSQFTIELGKYPDTLSVYPNSSHKFYYPFFHGKLLATTNGVTLNGAVSIDGYKFKMLQVLMIVLVLNFSYLTLNAIIDRYFFWALIFSLFGCAIIWIFMQFCIPTASIYEEKTKNLEAFLNALIADKPHAEELA